MQIRICCCIDTWITNALYFAKSTPQSKMFQIKFADDNESCIKKTSINLLYKGSYFTRVKFLLRFTSGRCNVRPIQIKIKFVLQNFNVEFLIPISLIQLIRNFNRFYYIIWTIACVILTHIDAV
jgi:hypothetical protein